MYIYVEIKRKTLHKRRSMMKLGANSGSDRSSSDGGNYKRFSLLIESHDDGCRHGCAEC